MNFQQLRALRETARRDLNLTNAAQVLHTSQPALSKQIRELEDELGVALFVRRGKKLAAMTEAGVRVLEIANRLLGDAQNIRRVSAEFANGETGTLTIAATHTQARYALPRRLARFRAEFPRIRLRLHQGNPQEVAEFVAHGDATFGFATESLADHPGLITHAIYTWRHCVVVPDGHPLSRAGAIGLRTLAAHPIVTYTPEFAGRRKVDQAFVASGLHPEIALEAIDSDVIKEYVSLGVGVGLIAEIAYDIARDTGLVRVELDEPLPANVARVATRAGIALRGFERRFLALVLEASGPRG
ncbi:MAG: LysR substrate-binding domain-containing protein [Burkholderiaceae bacterium]